MQLSPMAINHSTTDNNNPQGKQVVVVMIPLPAQGHLNQLLHLSRLISAYNIPVHYVGTATHNRQAKVRVHGWNPLANPNIIFHDFSIPSFHNPVPDPNAPTKFPSQLIPSLSASLQLREPISKLLLNLSTTAKRVIVIYDTFMAYTAQDVPTIPNAESYCFYCVSAFNLYSFIWEKAGKPNLPESHFFEDLPSRESCLDPAFDEFNKFNTECTMKMNSGYLYNTCRRIEGRFLELVAQSRLSDTDTNIDTDKNWAIGPFNPVVINEDKGSNKRPKCLAWLDEQPPNSVIFVSFGSTTSFLDEQISELASGLENSMQKFIWVLRDADKGDVFTGENRMALLPEGYEERIKERGIIIRDWAPQLEILGHPSTGGFMSHCGWNSCLESISLGVPIAAWPMHSDQPRNAILITKILKIGILVRTWAQREEVVKAETIKNVVKRLMDSQEGEGIRRAAVTLSEDVKESVMEDGQSHKEMESFIAHINR